MNPGLQVIDGGQAPRRAEVEEPDELRLSMDLESEAAILSSILNDEPLLDAVRPWLRDEHFYSEAHRRIFEACCFVRDAGKPLDVVTLATRLRDSDRLAQAGGMSYVTTVLNSAPVLGASRLKAYATSVRDKWVRRQTKALGNSMSMRSVTEAAPIESIISETRDLIDALSVELGLAEKNAGVKDVLRRTTERLGKMANTNGKGELPTGFDRFDALVGGLTPMLWVVAARPGVGKTSLATNIGVNVASRTDADGARRNGVYMASLETFDEEAMTRLWCAEARVDVKRARTGGLSRDEWGRLIGTAEGIGNMPMWIDDESAQTVSGIWSKCRRADMQLQRAGGKLRLVIVDYLQLLKAPRPKMPREEAVSENARMLVAMANDLKVCVLGLAQLNRDCEKRPNKRPQLSDLRESGELEQAARLVTFIYRDEYYNKQSQDRNVAELIIGKQNNGPTDTVRVRFDSQYTRFDNLAEMEESDHVDASMSYAPPSNTPAVKQSAVSGPETTMLSGPEAGHSPSRLQQEIVQHVYDAVMPGMTVSELKKVLGKTRRMSVSTVYNGVSAAIEQGLIGSDGGGDKRVLRRLR